MIVFLLSLLGPIGNVKDLIRTSFYFKTSLEMRGCLDEIRFKGMLDFG